MELKSFDQEVFEKLILEENFLGAWTKLKGAELQRDDEGVFVGLLARALIKSLSSARERNDREELMFNRSLLSYILRDYPGLASLYREQTRPSTPTFIPESLSDLWNDFSDVVAGRKSLDEEFRQRMEETKQRMKENSTGTETFDRVARDVEKEIKKGVEGVVDFLNGIWGVNTTNKTTTEDPQKKTPSQTEEPSIKINIQDADAPLPKDIHQAPPADKE